tara:strand:- start:7 stop:171 length:165 start_codon:yes stop_codon:yes gene_type:complete
MESNYYNTGLQKLADLRKEKRRAEKVETIAAGVQLGEAREKMMGDMMKKRKYSR